MNYCNPKGFKNEIKENIGKGKDYFFSWFDGGGTVDGAFSKSGEIFKRLMLPWAKGKLDEQISLDIGYGGGGQVLAASKHFKFALGVDVHEEIDFVENELRKRTSKKNIALFTGDGKTLPIDDNKVDFIYSWVTFLYVGTIEVVESYLKEMYRVLKDGGIAVIFFTRLIRSKRVQNLQEYSDDVVKEETHPTGYREGGPLTLVNRPNLVLSRWKMNTLIDKQGFAYISPTSSHEGDKIYGQHGIIFQKPVRTPKIAPTLSKPKIKPKIKLKKGRN